MFTTPPIQGKKDKSPNKSKEKSYNSPKVRQRIRSRFQSSVKKPTSGKTKSTKRSTAKPTALSFDSPQEQLITEHILRPQRRIDYSNSKLSRNINFFKSLDQPAQLDSTFEVAENVNETVTINVDPNDISLQELNLTSTEVKSFFSDINISTQKEKESVTRHSQASLSVQTFNAYTQTPTNIDSTEVEAQTNIVSLNDSFTQTDEDLWSRISKENDEIIKSINSLDIAFD